MGEVHLADLVRIGLHQNRHARILQRDDRAVLVGEDGHGEDYAVILALMLLQPVGIELALGAGLNAAEAGQLRVHHDVVVARVGHGLDHVLARAVDQFAGHEAAVAEAECKGHLFLHGCTNPFSMYGYFLIVVRRVCSPEFREESCCNYYKRFGKRLQASNRLCAGKMIWRREIASPYRA